jgi:hypothetical protein
MCNKGRAPDGICRFAGNSFSTSELMENATLSRVRFAQGSRREEYRKNKCGILRRFSPQDGKKKGGASEGQ